jgi:hypothetical protein
LVVGSYYGLHAMSLQRDANPFCDGDACLQPGLDLHDRVGPAATVSTVAFSVGLAAAGVALYLALTGDKPTPAPAHAPAAMRLSR